VLAETQRSDSASYDIHGIVGIGVMHCQNPIAQVIHRELQHFADLGKGERPDLTIVLGSVPSPDWAPHGTPIGEDLLCDQRTEEVTVLRRSEPVFSSDNVRFVLRGDTRRSGAPVSIYVPSLKTEAPRWLRVARVLVRHDFLTQEEAIADAILTGLVEPFLYYRLPNEGHSLVHASAVSNGLGILFYGSSNVGKTSMALHLVKEGFEFFGDDLVILNENGRLLAYPKRIKLEAQHLPAYPALTSRIGSTMNPVKRLLFKRFARNSAETPFQMMFYHPAISEIFDDVRIGRQSDLGALVYLKRAMRKDISLREIEMESSVEALATNLFWEFDTSAYRHNPYRYCMAYASNDDFLEGEIEQHHKVTRLLGKAISRARSFELQLPPKFETRHAHQAMDKLLSALG